MDLNEIKKIIEEDGGKIIIVENGEPVIVVTSFAEYQKSRKRPEPKPSFKEKNPKPVPAIPQTAPTEFNQEELKIEDLPF